MTRILTSSTIFLFSLALVFGFSAATVSAATVTLNSDLTISLPNGVSLTIENGGLYGQMVINDNSSMVFTTESDTDFTIVSTNQYDFTAVGAVGVIETCTSGTSNSLRITDSDASTVTINVDSETTCGGSSTTTTPTPSGGGGGGGGASASQGTGETTTGIGIGETKSISDLTATGNNILMHLDSTATFGTPVTSGARQNHSAKVTGLDLATKIVTILFNSDPVSVSLLVGATKNVDLNGDGQADISVTFNNLVVNQADLTFKVLAATVSRAHQLVSLSCPAGAEVNHPCKAVYYIGTDGKRYVFPNQKTYFTWYSDFSQVKTVSAEELASYAIGGNVTYRPGVKLVKITTDPKVYAVSKQGKLRWIATAEVATELYGGNWSSMVEDVPDAFFINYLTGTDINASAGFSVESAKSGSLDISTDKNL